MEKRRKTRKQKKFKKTKIREQKAQLLLRYHHLSGLCQQLSGAVTLTGAGRHRCDQSQSLSDTRSDPSEPVGVSGVGLQNLTPIDIKHQGYNYIYA